jgi:hypothetical protein
MKLLFVTHDISIYGASRSLQTLLRNYHEEDVEVHLLINKKIIGGNDIQAVKKRFGNVVKEVHELYLPIDPCWIGAPDLSVSVKIKNFLASITRRAFEDLLRRQRYDIVYLNSIVLHPLITREATFIVHVREVFKRSEEAISNIALAKGLIFIDSATEKAMRSLIPESAASIVLNNPFDMSAVEHVLPAEVGTDVASTTIITLIGQITEGKGTDFIIRTFVSSSISRTRLIIVGHGEDAYVTRCRKSAEGNPNVVFYGEEPQIERIFKIADYVIRGEAFPCIGRTVYEGLFSGCQVILPGDENLVVEKEVQNNVIYYQPRNAADLKKIFERIDGKKVSERKVRTNVVDYVRRFHSFLQRVKLK